MLSQIITKIQNHFHSQNPTLKFELKLFKQIVKMGFIIIIGITTIYVFYKLPFNEIRSAITYYYSESLVIDGQDEVAVNFISDSGVKITLPAINIVANPLIMLSKQKFNWALFKGLLIGYISFKIFCALFFLWIYFKKRKIN